jgi:hypothetical protein
MLCRLARVTIDGKFDEVSVDAEGTSSVHISGLEKKATLNLRGLPDVAITASKGRFSGLLLSTFVGIRI